MPEETKDINLQDPLLGTPEERLDQIKSLIQSTYHNLEKISRVVEKIQQEQRREMYKKMPGSEGMFDGVYLVMDDGSKLEVPPNYAAKSRLVYGDRLKVVEEDGKKVFKQIQKPERKEIEGVLSKKEGKWYLLAETGTYKISDVAAEFNKAELNEKAVGLVPADNLKVPFAALDKIVREGKEEAKPEEPTRSFVKPKEEEKKPEVGHKPIESKPVEKSRPTPIRTPIKKPFFGKKPEVSNEVKKPAPKPVENKQEGPKEFVANILEEDDLR